MHAKHARPSAADPCLNVTDCAASGRTESIKDAFSRLPVIAAGRMQLRVWPIARIQAIETLRDLSLHAQVLHDDLLVHWPAQRA